jgi:hypothetical protein
VRNQREQVASSHTRSTRRHSLLATYSRCFLVREFFYPEDGGNIFLRNVGSQDLHGATVSSHLLTLVLRSRIFLPCRWRRCVPPKRRFTQDLRGATGGWPPAHAGASLANFSTLKMEAIQSSEASIHKMYTAPRSASHLLTLLPRAAFFYFVD